MLGLLDTGDGNLKLTMSCKGSASVKSKEVFVLIKERFKQIRLGQNKAGGGDRIPAELFYILKDDIKCCKKKKFFFK